MAPMIEFLAMSTPDGGDRTAVGHAVVMFLAIAGLLGLFFVALLLLARSRMRRQQRAERKERPTADPWSEAGRRVSADDLHGPGPGDQPT